MSHDYSLLPSFFQACDRVFALYNIEEAYRVPILVPLLTDKARLLLTSLPFEETKTFEGLRRALTREFKMTQGKYKKLFYEAERQSDETFVNFSTRLTLNFEYYLDSCKVEKNYDKLFELMVKNKLKSSMKDWTREKIREFEMGSEVCTLREIAERADVLETDKTPFGFKKQNWNKNKFTDINSTDFDKNNVRGAEISGVKPEKTCFRCNGKHKWGACPMFHKDSNFSASNRTGSQSGEVITTPPRERQEKSFDTNFRSPGGRNQSFYNKSYRPFQRNENKTSQFGRNRNDHHSNSGNRGQSYSGSNQNSNTRNANRVTLEPVIDLSLPLDPESKLLNLTESNTDFDIRVVNNVQVAEVGKIDKIASLDIGRGPVKFLIDSGADISIISRDMIPEGVDISSVGTVMIKPFIGKSVRASLVLLPTTLCTSETCLKSSVLLSFAVLDKLECTYPLITLEDFRLLSDSASFFIPRVRYLGGCCEKLEEGVEWTRTHPLTVGVDPVFAAASHSMQVTDRKCDVNYVSQFNSVEKAKINC